MLDNASNNDTRNIYSAQGAQEPELDDCPCSPCRRARRRTDKPKSYEPEVDFLGVWVAIIALAVVVAVFGSTLGGVW